MTRAPGEWITVKDVERRFGVCRGTINKAIKNGRIEAVWVGRRRWVMAWKAAELWEYRLLAAQGMRRCVECLEVKAIEAFPIGRPECRRRTCRDCWRPIAARAMGKYRQRAAVQRRQKAWYAARGGCAAYHKARRLARRLAQVVSK